MPRELHVLDTFALQLPYTRVVVCGGMSRSAIRRAPVRGAHTMPIGEILWWLLLAGVLVWGWDYISQFKR